MSDTSMSDSYNEMVLKTSYEEEEEAIDEHYIDEDINMDDIMQPSPITTGNTTSTPNPPTMEEANENRLLALLTLRTQRRSVEATPHNVNTNTAVLVVRMSVVLSYSMLHSYAPDGYMKCCWSGILVATANVLITDWCVQSCGLQAPSYSRLVCIIVFNVLFSPS